MEKIKLSFDKFFDGEEQQPPFSQKYKKYQFVDRNMKNIN